MEALIEELKVNQKLTDSEAMVTASVLSLIAFSKVDIDSAFHLMNEKLKPIVKDILQ